MAENTKKIPENWRGSHNTCNNITITFIVIIIINNNNNNNVIDLDMESHCKTVFVDSPLHNPLLQISVVGWCMFLIGFVFHHRKSLNIPYKHSI